LRLKGTFVAMDHRDHDLSWLHSGRIPALDGLRAVAILLVLVGHGATWSLPDISPRVSRLGEWGVDLFFALSGFLITILLIREYQRHGSISLPNFYQRRALRILPPYFVFLAGYFVMKWALGAPLPAAEWWGLLTFTINCFPTITNTIGHTWTLCLEEQFYLAWPLMLLVLGPRRALTVAVVWILLTPLVRQLVASLLPEINGYTHTLTRIDGLMTGAALALMASGVLGWRLAPVRRLPWLWLALLAGSLFGFRELCEAIAPLQPFYHTATAFIMAAVVWIASSSGDRLLLAWLEHPIMVSIGLLSYSLYLWHEPFLVPHSGSWWTECPWNFALLFTAAAASYLLIERPLQTWRAHLRAKVEAPAKMASPNAP
jgi:peptidoglycan/LPS O-acetylase OafA/YrhL